MFAVIETGGHQYKVQPGDVIDVERTDDAAAQGKKKRVRFERVLLVSGDDGVRVGAPLVEGAKVEGVMVDEELKGPKVVVFKKKRRKGYKRRRGHRQELYRVRIDKIEA